jgi:hypothetical protein
MGELHWTEVDGVTTVWAESQGPLSGGLLFRSGRCDETLMTSGWNHLIEHMAISGAPNLEERRQGFVGGLVTAFSAMGRPEEVAAFLSGVCSGLSSLSARRLEAEKQVLEAEEATRGYNLVGELLAWRYGAAGYGLLGMPELGIRKATLEELQSFCSERFSRRNAILWFSGPPPEDVRLHLPEGQKLAVPRLTTVVSDFPRWFVTNQFGGVALGAVIPRKPVVTLFCDILGKRLRERLRTEQAVSYAPQVDYEPLDAKRGHLICFADSDEQRREELMLVFAEVVEGLSEVEQAEVKAAKAEYLDCMVGPLAPPPDVRVQAALDWAAMDWISGRDYEPMDEIVGGVAATTADEIADVGRLVQEHALFAVPPDVDPQEIMGSRAPLSRGAPVEGEEAASLDAPIVADTLVVGSDGVSVKLAGRMHATVRYARLEGALSYRDGCIRLIGRDGTWLTIEPTMWRDGVRLCREIRESVPAHLLLDHGSRSADEIPRPQTTAMQRLKFRLGSK